MLSGDSDFGFERKIRVQEWSLREPLRFPSPVQILWAVGEKMAAERKPPCACCGSLRRLSSGWASFLKERSLSVGGGGVRLVMLNKVWEGVSR